MNGNSHVTLRWPVVAVAMIALLAVGVGGTYLWMKRSVGADRGTQPMAAAPKGAPSSTTQPPTPEVVVTLSQAAMQRAGIELATVTEGTRASALRIPGTVEPNAYKQVVVTPLVAGRVTRVLAELGTQVRRGQTLAQVFSPELADAQMKYVSMKADLEAHEREVGRTTKLVEIGAASRQELERLHAEHTAKLAGVQSLRSRLVLLGMPAPAIDAMSSGKEIEATTNIPAPMAGAITERAANVGLNVDTSTKLFTVVDLSSVWVVGALYERDFSRVRVGSAASVTTSAYSGLVLRGRVTYIDPQVSADTRTAGVRVEVPNPRQELRLGMYADIEVAATSDRPVVTIPRGAVQNVGDRQVVYVANPGEPGKFVEREVRLGEPLGEQLEVVSGVQPGDHVVATGSFFVRAERERLGVATPGVASRNTGSPAESRGIMPGAAVHTTKVTVGEQGFEPARVTLQARVAAHLTFLRTTDKTCATAVVFPRLNIRRELPLNQPVDIELRPQQTGDIQFACGMNMFRGTLVVR
jgi:membrane fusion protein, heavy metal efflux system